MCAPPVGVKGRVLPACPVDGRQGEELGYPCGCGLSSAYLQGLFVAIIFLLSRLDGIFKVRHCTVSDSGSEAARVWSVIV